MASRDVWIARSRAELLAGVQSRVVVDPGDARSGSVFERVTIDGERYFAKTLGYRTDWIMRITGDRDLRTLKIWRAGIMRDVPPEIDHTVVGMAADGEGEDALLTILMHDVADQLFAEGDATISLEDHLGLVDGLAALSARYWGWSDDIGLTTLEERLRFFALDNIAAEAAVADPPLPVRVAMQGWPRLARTRARAVGVGRARSTPRPARSRTRCVPHPATFLQGDWKMGNLGRHRDGRTILLDWAYPGSGPVCWDLAWYLALNCARLPIDKEATIEALRGALERRGVSTDWLVRPATRPVPARHGRVLRVGEGDGRRRRTALVGGTRRPRRPPRRRRVPAITRVNQDHYRGAAMGWAQGATLVYAPIAALLIARTPIPLTGARVLDVGAGTGVCEAPLRAAGTATVMAADLSHDMLAWNRTARPPAVVADVMRLPFPSAVFDVAVASFVLNHLTDPVGGFAELARVSTARRRRARHCLREQFAQREPRHHRRDRSNPRVGTARVVRGAQSDSDTATRRVRSHERRSRRRGPHRHRGRRRTRRRWPHRTPKHSSTTASAKHTSPNGSPGSVSTNAPQSVPRRYTRSKARWNPYRPRVVFLTARTASRT